MHVYYKFGLLLIFILSASTCYTRAAPSTNQSSSYGDDYDDYEDYYDENETNPLVSSTQINRLMPAAVRTTPQTMLINNIDVPKRSNHVLEPKCPKACLCMEDSEYVQCSNARLNQVPHDLPSTALIIDLSQNYIKQLRSDDFINCTKVREIKLNNNELREIPKEAFEGLHRLERLNLANNRLTIIEPNTFTGANDLTKLDLSNNSIFLDDKGSFLNQPYLLELSCRNCSWTQLYDETFANLSALTTLKLDINDFSKKINTQAFIPLRSLIKLKLPELDETSVQELCNLLKSIDNISFKHFDISCYELVLGTSFNESVIFVTDPPFEAPLTKFNPYAAAANEAQTDSTTNKKKQHISNKSMTEGANGNTFLNFTMPKDSNGTVLSAGVLHITVPPTDIENVSEEKPYQVPISQEAIKIMLIGIMIIAIIGLIIGVICRKDIGGIKTKCCRTRKPEPRDQVHPTEEIPLNKLA